MAHDPRGVEQAAMDLLDRLPEKPKRLCQNIADLIAGTIEVGQQPSARELLAAAESAYGWPARLYFIPVIQAMRADRGLHLYARRYLTTTLDDAALEEAIRGDAQPTPAQRSTVDELFHASLLHRHTDQFTDTLEFIAKFRSYAPYNNMLVRLQNPTTTFYATAQDWWERFGRRIKEDTNPLLILAPMHPVMLVFDVEQTEGPPLPADFREFSDATGEFDTTWMDRLLQNAARLQILVQRKPLAKLNAGFATMRLRDDEFKMRVVVDADLDGPSAFCVLCHELAHILLGHLGTDQDRWWPYRVNLDGSAVEVEAEAVAYVVAARLGLTSSSASYIAGYARAGRIPSAVSLDNIVKVAGHLTDMTSRLLPKRLTKAEKIAKAAASPS